MTFHFITCHSYLMLHGEMLFSRLYPRIKNGWFIGNPNQHCRAHSRRIRARHSRDEGTTSQVDRIDWGTYWSYIRKHLWVPIFSTATVDTVFCPGLNPVSGPEFIFRIIQICPSSPILSKSGQMSIIRLIQSPSSGLFAIGIIL